MQDLNIARLVLRSGGGRRSGAWLAFLELFKRFHSAAHPALECSINVMLRIRGPHER
jgi:hypothetical protein